MSLPRSVVITGASTGIGRECALRMDALGWRVFAGVRRDADGASLRAEASERLTPLMLDVTKAEAVARVEKIVGKTVGDGGLDGLVNNAGIPYGGPIEFLDLAELRRTFEVNFFGLVHVTQALIPLLRRASGHIVNMSSLSGWIASPFLSPYSTSKFALEALSDALRVELEPWKIHVAVIEPGAIDTPIWGKGKEIIGRLATGASSNMLKLYGPEVEAVKQRVAPHGIPPSHVVKAVEHALTARKPRTRYTVGRDAALVRVFRYLPDRWRDAFYLKSWLRRR
jgi:NAD(P)-dependent dehydrogenase (short-subunit alcohol dehydrogenase family)